jgi:hypothetical protein
MNTLKVRINYSPDGNVVTSNTQGGERMKSLTVKMTREELRLLATLASDQLFRRQFIDPRMPGHKPNSEEINLGKALVARLRLMVDKDVSPPTKVTE